MARLRSIFETRVLTGDPEIATNLRQESAFKQIKLAEHLRYYVDVQKLALVHADVNNDHLLSTSSQNYVIFFHVYHRSITRMKQRWHTALHSTRL